ncbi:MAG: hypothetical protein AB8G15_08470 [Saprospiraceae bacterium]
MTTDSPNRLRQLLSIMRGNDDLAFAKYLEECLAQGTTLYIPEEVSLQLKTGFYPIDRVLRIEGGGTIRGNGKSNLFELKNNADIQFKNVSFKNFACVLKAGKRDISYQLDIDGIQLENCQSLVFAGLNNKEVKKVGPISIKNSVFKNCIGPVIEIRNLHLNQVEISKNRFFNTQKLKHKSAVIEVGGGTNFSRATNVKVQFNTIDNFNFVDKACGIIVHGASEVVISDNQISNLCSTHISDKDSHGIYIKASNTKILRNTLIDAGEGEAAIINKGLAKNHAYTTPGTPSGDNVLIEGNKISYTNEYHLRAKKNITGITVTGTNQTVRNNTIKNVTNGIELRSGQLVKGKNYTGGFTIVGNKIHQLQHCLSRKGKSAVQGIAIMQQTNNVMVKQNEIKFTPEITSIPTYVFGIACLTNGDTENIVIEENTIENKLTEQKDKSSYAINVRTKGIIKNLVLLNNVISGFSYGVVLNDNNNLATYQNVKVDNQYKNIHRKKQQQITKHPQRHSIRFKKD